MATFSSVEYDLIPAPPRSFAVLINQLPPAENRLLASVSLATCDAETGLVQYLQLDCTVFIGTDGGKRHHNGSFSWVICFPEREKLVLNAGPVDGWHKCQNSLRSEVAALASVTLYLDELVEFYSVNIKCRFLLFVERAKQIKQVNLWYKLLARSHEVPDLSTVLFSDVRRVSGCNNGWRLQFWRSAGEEKKTEYLFYVLPLFRTKTELDSHG